MPRAFLLWAVLILTATQGAWGQPRVTAQVGRCRIETTPAYGGQLRRLAAEAEELLPRLEADLGIRAQAPYRILLIPPGAERDAEMARLDALAPPWASGFLVAQARVGAIRLALVDRYPYDDAASVFVHEVTHMLLHDAAGEELPRWFEEGVATWEGRRWGLRDVLVYSSSILARKLPTLDQLEGEFNGSAARARLAYAASFDFVSWSVRQYGPEVVVRVLRETRAAPFSQAWEAATGVPLEDSEASWRRGSVFLYRWLPVLGGPGTLWLLITLLALVAGIRRRRRSRELLARWEREEQGWSPGLPEEEDEEERDALVN